MDKRTQRKIYLKAGNTCSNCGTPIGQNQKHCRKHRTNPSGEKAPNWKGGRVKATSGYILIMKPEHPRANPDGYVYEHIVIWEQANNKSLPLGWVIHHLNGIITDNRPVNLEAMPDRRHNNLLAAKARRIQELEAMLNNQHQLL